MRKYVVVEIIDGIQVPRSGPLSRPAAAIECARLSEDGSLVCVEPAAGTRTTKRWRRTGADSAGCFAGVKCRSTDPRHTL